MESSALHALLVFALGFSLRCCFLLHLTVGEQIDLILALDLKSWSSVKLGRGARYLRLTDGSHAHCSFHVPCIGSRFAQLELTVLSPAQVVATCVPLSLRDDGVPWRPGARALFVLL